jgi:outer membrane autotransporter protein
VVEASTIGGSIITTDGTVSNSQVSVTGGDIKVAGNVSGGFVAGDGSAAGNAVAISGTASIGSTTTGGAYYIYGGRVGGSAGNADGNSITVAAAATIKDVANLTGGYSAGGHADSNTVDLAVGKVNSVRGGQSDAATGGQANENVVTLAGATTLNTSAHAGLVTGDGEASDNILTITGAAGTSADTAENALFAGQVQGDGTASGNRLIVNTTGTIADKHLIAGWTGGGEASGNTLQIIKGTITDATATGASPARQLIGGFSGTGDVTGNEVLIGGGTIALGNAGSDIIGGFSLGTGEVAGNLVQIDGKADIAAADILGAQIAGASALTVTGNNVVIALDSGGSVKASGAGGPGRIAGAATNGAGSELDDNNVTISEGVVEASTIGGSIITTDGTVSNSQVSVTGGDIKVAGNVSGGFVAGDGSAAGNAVEISGGAELSAAAQGGVYTIYGGYVGGASGEASDNTVTVSGSAATFTDTANLFGGYSGAGDAKANTVTLTGADNSGLNVGSVVAGLSNDASAAHEVSGNQITVKNVIFEGDLAAGLGTDDDDVNGNTITITGGKNEFKNVFVGLAGATENAHDNSLVIQGGTENKFEGDIVLGGNLTVSAGTNVFDGIIDTATTVAALATDNGNITISGGSNDFNNALIADYDLVVSAGTNQFDDASATLTAGHDIAVSTSGNTFSGAFSAGNDISIDGSSNDLAALGTTGGSITIDGDDNKLQGALNSGKDITIDGSGNIFDASTSLTAVHDIIVDNGDDYDFLAALSAGNDIAVTGDDIGFGSTVAATAGSFSFDGSKATFSADLTAGNGMTFEDAGGGAVQIIFLTNLAAKAGSGAMVFDNAEVVATQGATLQSDAGVTFRPGSTLDLGTKTLTVDGDALFDHTVIDFYGSATPSEHGNIVSGTGSDFHFDDAEFVINEVAGDPNFWDDRTLVSTAGGITGTYSVDDYFYDLDQTGGVIKIEFAAPDSYITKYGLQVTPNVKVVSQLIDGIRDLDQNQPLIQALNESLRASVGVTNHALAEIAVRQLIGEPMVNTLAAVERTAQKTQGIVLGRLDRIREVELDSLVPPASGYGDELNRIWVAGFGVWAEADDRNHVFGYDYNAHGAALGYDRHVDSLPGLLLGVNAIFAKGEMESDRYRSDADLDTIGIGVYGSYTFQNGLFLDANVAYGSTQSDYTIDEVLGGTATGDFDVDSWQLGLRAGAVLKAADFQLIPSVGIRYTHFKQHGWTETLSAAALANGVLAHQYGARTDKQIDIPVQLKINTTIEAGSAVVTPELRLGATFTPKRHDSVLRVGFAGSNLSAEIVGVRPGSTTFNAGLGVKISTASMFDAYLNYDLDASSGFTSHNVSVGIGIDF